MSLAHCGYVGLGCAVVYVSPLTQNVGVAVGIVTLLVLISTLLIRFTSTVEKTTKGVIHEMQADGDLPTTLERTEIRQALESLDAKLDRILEGQ